MKDYSKDFESFDGNMWLNAASEGPLPKVAAAALQESVVWKSKPYLLDDPKFIAAAKDLKDSIGKLIGVNPKDVILANSASYGIHILANGYPWVEQDEIILMQNDFPSDIIPWLALQKKGVNVKQVAPKDRMLTPQEFKDSITEKTRLFCISHVHSFTGVIAEIDEFAKICRQNKIIFVLNLSQSAGAMPINLSRVPVDAVVSAGYKWLCGPYGTGFAWIKPELRNQLEYNQAYWIPYMRGEDLLSEGPLEFREMKTARKYDVFGTANFFNFVPFRAAIDYWLSIGLEEVQSHNTILVDQIIENLDDQKYELISPESGPSRSGIVVISHKDKKNNEKIFKSMKKRGIFPAFWKGNIRLAPHLYNSQEDMENLTNFLTQIQ